MSCNLLCAQCRRKNPKETSVSNSFCGGCNERLCPECSKNHTAIKGFSNHELVLSDSFSSHNFESSHQCNILHPNMTPTRYCFRYDIYLCESCENKTSRDSVSCNTHHVCFHTNPSYFVLPSIKTQVGSELEKMKKTLDVCYSSRVANEEVLTTQISETSLDNDDDKRKIFDVCLNQLKSEKKGIEKLQQYLQFCLEEFKLHFMSKNPRTLSFLMRMSNLKQDIITLYSSLNKISIRLNNRIEYGRLERHLSPICETRNLIMKSFQIEGTRRLPTECVKKVMLIDNHIVVFTNEEIQRFNCTNQLEGKSIISHDDSAYIKKYRLVALLHGHGFGSFAIKFLNIDSFVLEEKQLEFSPANQTLSQIMHVNIIDATSEFVFFAGHKCAGRVNFDGNVECVPFNDEVGSSMHISNDEIFIPSRNCIKIYSLQFKCLRYLTLDGEVLVQGTEFKRQYQQFGNSPPFINNYTIACNFIFLTTDHDNNVYAAMNSHDIMRWNRRKKEWECVLTGCHGVRKPFCLCFDDEFANLYVCSNAFNCDPKLLLKYKVNLDIVDI